MSLVKIYTRIIKKHYLNQKRVYKHRHIAIPIPSKFHEQLQPFLDKNLEINVTTRPNKLTITLTSKPNPRKNDSSRRKHPRKNSPETHI